MPEGSSKKVGLRGPQVLNVVEEAAGRNVPEGKDVIKHTGDIAPIRCQ